MKQIVMSILCLSLINVANASQVDKDKQQQFKQPKTMSCVVGVVRAKDTQEGKSPDQTTQIVRINLDEEGSADQEVKLNGETVVVLFYKKDHTQVYNAQFILMTPEADRMPKSPFVTSLQDYLNYEGPARDDGFSPDVGAGSQAYEYLNKVNGSIRLTPKVRVAMDKAGFWGTAPGQYSSTLLDIYAGQKVFSDVLPKLLEMKLLTENDVIAIYTIFNCTGNL